MLKVSLRLVRSDHFEKLVQEPCFNSFICDDGHFTSMVNLKSQLQSFKLSFIDNFLSYK